MARNLDLLRYPALAAVLAASLLFQSNYITNVLLVIGLHALPAIGLSLLMGYAGQISLGHAAFYGLGAYGSALIALHAGLNPWLSMLVATALVGMVGWALGWLVFRLHGHYLAMATLGLGVIVHVGFVELRDWTGGPNGLTGIPTLDFLGEDLASDQMFLPVIWGVLLLAIFFAENLVRSPLGLSLRAIGENEKVAASLGTSPGSYKRLILMVSAVYAAIAGGLYAHYVGYLSPSPFDVGFSIKLLVMVAIGGFARIWGVLFGVAFVTLLSEVLKPFGDYDIILFGLLLILTMIFCPEGLLERGRRLVAGGMGSVRKATP